MKKKKLPAWLENSPVSSLARSRIGVVLSYWLFQGMLYMDWRERLLKLFLDAVAVGALFAVGVNLPVALLVAHTANMLLNGHLLAMRRHMGLGTNDPERFICYLEGLRERMARREELLGGAAYGSLSRNVFRPTSDVDVRVFPRSGRGAWLRSVLWVAAERCRALAHAFPLDIYAFDLKAVGEKMRSDEPPIIFLDRQRALVARYPEQVAFDSFAERFRAKYLAAGGERR